MKDMCKGCFYEHLDWNECFSKWDDPNCNECDDRIDKEDIDLEYDEEE